MLYNRRFTVSLSNKRNRWRNQRSGLPLGSVVASMLLSIYTNDQSILEETKHFLYANYLTITVQNTTFQVVKRQVTKSLQKLTNYSTKSQLKPNPDKTYVYSFYLRNREAKRKLKV